MKRVLITGGDGDIARAIVCQLEKLGGYEVRSPGKHELDVTSIESAEAFVAAWVPDILVNNAGYVVPVHISEADIAQEKMSLDINLFGVFNCTHAVLNRNPNARIVNVGSSAATKVHGTWSSYCAGKAGVVMATRCWASDGFDVICLSPGRTHTKMRASLYPNEDLSTLMSADDFARVVVKGILGEFEPGTHLDVNVASVASILFGSNCQGGSDTV